MPKFVVGCSSFTTSFRRLLLERLWPLWMASLVLSGVVHSLKNFVLLVYKKLSLFSAEIVVNSMSSNIVWIHFYVAIEGSLQSNHHHQHIISSAQFFYRSDALPDSNDNKNDKLCAWRHNICLRPSPPRGRPSASRAAEQTQRSSTFPRRIRSHADRCSSLTRFDLSTFSVLSDSRATWAISVPILVFLGLSVLDLGPMNETDRQTDRQTSDKTSLNAPAY